MLKKLHHKGILIPDPPVYHGITLAIRGQQVKLTPKQEEMALAWARKQGTPYVEDLIFVKNFMLDFSRALNIQPVLKVDEVDFSPLIKIVESERAAREAMSKEEKKALAAQRKQVREQLKEEYGFALADDERIELANYLAEPSGIFMGRGKHPLRGKWKEGASQSDITLNISPDAPVPPGEWKDRVWQPESLWVARWEDKLSGKIKYIWLHDTAPVKQVREAQKFDKAIELDSRIQEVRRHIQEGLSSDKPKIRRVATACFLIDALCLRVGDEKDADEADTVGATTLRPEHIKLLDDGKVEFRFLGKDSVLWHKKIELPQLVRDNLQELIKNAEPSANAVAGKSKNSAYFKPQLFPDITSRNVNEYLSQAMPGLSAKVFRTHHATTTVRENLENAGVVVNDPEYKKWEAVVKANLEAAILCNHTKQAPKNWENRKKNYRDREMSTQKRLETLKKQLLKMNDELKTLKQEAKEKKTQAKTKQAKQKAATTWNKRITAKEKLIAKAAQMEEKTRQALGKLRAQKAIAMQNRTWNLGTSQKSYIDPRVFYNWGNRVNYDVLEKYYSSTLRRKFMWVKNIAEADTDDEE
ncbi:MAG TPA: DNA topoisomerase I [bacterium]|nr:DNA topoisomerase I [bacterium]HPN43306.1 DNA topoisomerase I [bacterium]